MACLTWDGEKGVLNFVSDISRRETFFHAGWSCPRLKKPQIFLLDLKKMFLQYSPGRLFGTYVLRSSAANQWMFPKNRGTPKSSILIGFPIINHPFWGISIFGNTPMSNGYRWFNGAPPSSFSPTVSRLLGDALVRSDSWSSSGGA